MKPPAKGDPKVVTVHEYAPAASMRDHQLSIGAAQVSDVKGTPIHPPGMTAYGRVLDQDKWDYTFTLREGGRSLRAECTEQVGDVRFFALGAVMLDLRCSCFEGSARLATLAVVNGKGSAVLPGNMHYAVSETRQSKQGRSARSVLGYNFHAATGTGAIDITRQALAYMPKQLSEEQRLPLTCLYAALLLHRPVK